MIGRGVTIHKFGRILFLFFSPIGTIDTICEWFLPIIACRFDSGAMEGFAQIRLYVIFSHTELPT